jgi:hypothetical protein
MALTWEQHQKNIFGGESGGDYDALFGYHNRPDGAFSNVKVSQMPVGDVIDFTDPSGTYGRWVKGQLGYTATPVGAYQVVGTTLRDAVKALGIDPNQKFDKATQDKIGQYILKTQGTGAWEGYGKGGASMDNKPAQMAQQQQPQGLLSGLLGGQGIGGALGLSDDFRDKLKMGILLGSDPRAFAPMVEGIQARGKERRAEAKELKSRNKSLDYLTKKANAGDDLAAEYLGVISTGAVDAGSGLASYLKASTATDSSSSAFGEKFNIYKKAMPEATDMQILEKMNEKDLPATFEALDMTARAAGFKPKTEGGDGQYEEFMAGQGAGFKRAAQNLADMNFEQLQEYTKTLGKAERTTKLIDQIKSSQYLDGVLGRVEGKIPVSSWLSLGVFDQDETDLIQLIDNLENSVFLEAFQELKGGGQITELEGEKAQRAIVNLNRDRSKKAFLEALDTLQGVIDAGVGRAKRGVSVNNPYTKDLVVGGGSDRPSEEKPAASSAVSEPVVIDGYSIVKVE